MEMHWLKEMLEITFTVAEQKQKWLISKFVCQQSSNGLWNCVQTYERSYVIYINLLAFLHVCLQAYSNTFLF